MPTKTYIDIKEGASNISSTNNRRPSDLHTTDLVELSEQLNTSNQNTTVAKPPNDNTTTKEDGQGESPQEQHQARMSKEEGNYDADQAAASAAAASAGEHDGINGITGIKDADLEKTAFPILLHEIVTDPSTDDCIHWLSCGTRFMISDKKKFAKDVLPRFYGHAKFTSFTRRLKRWSFTRVPSGPFMGAYFNPNFRRNEPAMASRVRYDHPTPLSGAAMQLNKAKLQALGAGGFGAAAGMMGMGSAYGMAPPQMSLEEREALLRSMGMMQPTMATMQQPQGGVGGGNNIESLYRSMAQHQNNGMPVPGGGNGQQGQGGGANGSNPNLAATNNSVAFQMAMAQEMQRQRQAAMMGNNMMGMQQNPQGLLEILKQQQGQVSNPNMQQQGGQQPGQGQQGMVGGGDSGGSLSNNNVGAPSSDNNAPQLNFNSGMGMAGQAASNNPTAMNALLADYLNRQQQGGDGGGGDVKQEGGAQQVNNGGGDN